MSESQQATAKPGLSGLLDSGNHKMLDLNDQDMSMEVRNLNLYYGDSQALKNISMDIAHQRVTAFIGPSGCGKSTLLRCFNRMNDLIDSCRIEGQIRIGGEDIYQPGVDVPNSDARSAWSFRSPI